MQTVEIQLRSARAALEEILVPGRYAGLMDGAIQAISNCIAAIDKAKKEAQAHEDHNEPGADV